MGGGDQCERSEEIAQTVTDRVQRGEERERRGGKTGCRYLWASPLHPESHAGLRQLLEVRVASTSPGKVAMLLAAVLSSDLVFLKGELVSRLVSWSSDSLHLGFWTPPCSHHGSE